MSSNKDAPKVGDLYADCDPRRVGRVVEVIELLYSTTWGNGLKLCNAVRVRVVQDRRRFCLRSSVGKETRISVERFLWPSNTNNRGYRRIRSLDQA